ncbi:hypothetical protein [Erwinia phage FBB1]|nr:hypothetical protein [Erwinia phage FBB1]
MAKFKAGTKVKVVGGRYKNNEGVILSVHNSTRDGVFYKLELGSPHFPVQVTEKYLAALISFNDPKPSAKEFEGKHVKVVSVANVVEKTNPADFSLDIFERKSALCTLVYEEDGVFLANIVYQGQYAVLPVSDIEVSNESFPGLA